MNLQDIMAERSQSRQGQTTVIFYLLFTLTNRIQTAFDNMGDDITLKQLMLLILIGILKTSSYTQLGEIMGSSRQNIKNLAVSLERKGYVTIETDTDDRRAVKVQATDKIEEHFSRQDPIYEAGLKELFDDLSDQEVATLFKLIPKLLAGVERMNEF